MNVTSYQLPDCMLEKILFSDNDLSSFYLFSFQTSNRKRPTFGGYSTKQEMCLSFLTYYPRIDLAGCYSMTPVREFFETFGVYQFYSLNMTDVENLFLYNGDILDYIPNTIYAKTKKNRSNLTEEDVLYEDSLLS